MIRHIFDLCGCGGIGRRARFRFWWETVQVQVLLTAEKRPLLFQRVVVFFVITIIELAYMHKEMFKIGIQTSEFVACKRTFFE